MANLAIAALLVALIIAGIFLAPEPFVSDSAVPGEKYSVLSNDEMSCSVEIGENLKTMENDVKCGPTTKALGVEGIYQRSGYDILNNGRMRKFEGDADAVADANTCTLLMSDDLVQYKGNHVCGMQNEKLYSTDHRGTIDAITKGPTTSPWCKITFNPEATSEGVKNYLAFISANAALAVIDRPVRAS